LERGYTNIRKLDFADLAPPNKSRHFVLLPCFDSSSVPEERVEMVEAVSFVSLPSRKTARTKIPETSHHEQHGHARSEVQNYPEKFPGIT
jgi:hypothetical protein